jgi:hypothetical protein
MVCNNYFQYTECAKMFSAKYINELICIAHRFELCRKKVWLLSFLFSLFPSRINFLCSSALIGCCSPGVQLVCHYCLRAALLCCLLSGAALAVAGAVLQRHEHEDLGVLLYIGVLAALVSLVLLLVQWRSRRPTPRPRPRAAPNTAAPHRAEESVPLQQLRPQVLVVPPPQHTQINSGNFPMTGGGAAAHHWQVPSQLAAGAGVNPYQFHHGLTIPQQSAR